MAEAGPQPGARSAGEFCRFALVGLSGVVVDIAVLKAYLAVAGDRPYSGQVLGWLAAVTSNWWLNRRFTFRDRPRSAMLHQWMRFVVVNSGGAVVNYATYVLLVATLGFCRTHPSVAVGAGAVAGFLLNFSASRRLVFRR